MQGVTIVMIAYGIGILPLIRNLKRYLHDVMQPWNTDDTRSLGTLAIIETYFNFLTRQGPGNGYYPKPPKSVLVMYPENLKVKNYSAHAMSLKCARAHVISELTLGTTIPNTIG